ncbi:unnamed protein product [Choristocarpus tenellus]
MGRVLASDTSKGSSSLFSSGKGCVPMMVSPHDEILRQQAVARVFSRFQVLGKELGIKLKNEVFERWQFSRKLHEERGGDPLIPLHAFNDGGLHRELVDLGLTKAQAKIFVCQLGRASNTALEALAKQMRMPRGSSKGVMAKRVDETTYVLKLGKTR